MSNYLKYIKYKKKYLIYKKLLNNNNIKMIGGKSLLYKWNGIWTPPFSTIIGDKYNYTGNFHGSVSYFGEILNDDVINNIKISGTWSGNLNEKNEFIGTYNKDKSLEAQNYHWNNNKLNSLEKIDDNTKYSNESYFIEPNIELVNKEKETFTIYTTGICNNYVYLKNENKIFIKWNDTDGVLENILKLIPERYKEVNIIHTDIIEQTITKEEREKAKKYNNDILNEKMKNINNYNKIITVKFTTNELNLDYIETKNKNTYIVIDFAHIFRNIDIHKIEYSNKTYNVNSIYIGYIGEFYGNDFLYKSGLLFKVNENNIETYIDYIYRKNIFLYISNYTKENFILYPNELFKQIMKNVKKNIQTKINKDNINRLNKLDELDLILKDNYDLLNENLLEFGIFIIKKLINYNDSYIIHNLSEDGFTSTNIIKGGPVKISFNVQKNEECPIPDVIKEKDTYYPLKYLKELFDNKIILINNSYVVLSIGGNDIRHILGNLKILPETIKTFHENYQIIINNIKKYCNNIIIMLQYRPDINTNNHKVYENISTLPPNNLKPIEKMNILMENIYPKIFEIARINNIPIIDLTNTFDYTDSSLYENQIEPSYKGGQLISKLISYVIYNHNFYNESIFYSENIDKKIKTKINNEGIIWKLDIK